MGKQTLNARPMNAEGAKNRHMTDEKRMVNERRPLGKQTLNALQMNADLVRNVHNTRWTNIERTLCTGHNNERIKLMKNVYFAHATLRSRGIRPAKQNDLLEENG